jgi:hypothetical protein
MVSTNLRYFRELEADTLPGAKDIEGPSRELGLDGPRKVVKAERKREALCPSKEII